MMGVMKYLTPELLSKPGHCHTEAKDIKPLFDAFATPLARISSGNFVQRNPEFELYRKSLAEVPKTEIMIGDVAQSFESAPFAEVAISTDGLRRILSRQVHSEQLGLDIMAYTNQTLGHRVRWTAAHYLFYSSSYTAPDILDATVDIGVQGLSDNSHSVITAQTPFAPKWMLGRAHLNEEEPDEVAEHMQRELAHEFGTDNLTYQEYRAALWIADAIDRGFPAIEA
jgi:hypothetical protein